VTPVGSGGAVGCLETHWKRFIKSIFSFPLLEFLPDMSFDILKTQGGNIYGLKDF